MKPHNWVTHLPNSRYIECSKCKVVLDWRTGRTDPTASFWISRGNGGNGCPEPGDSHTLPWPPPSYVKDLGYWSAPPQASVTSAQSALPQLSIDWANPREALNAKMAKITPPKTHGCECGAHKLGYAKGNAGHSSWCPWFSA